MIVQANDLWKSYGHFAAVQGVSFAVPEGSIFALVGASGAGKTTLIKLLMNILTPSRGSCHPPRRRFASDWAARAAKHWLRVRESGIAGTAARG
jgi:ABC-type multidrug transport system ATPase subunit